MKRNNAQSVKKYYSQVAREIPLFCPHRRKILIQLENSLQVYNNEHSDITYDDLIENFDTPAAFADSLVFFESPQDIRKGLFSSMKAKISILILGILIIISTVAVVKISGTFATNGMIELEVTVNSDDNDMNQKK